MIYECKTLKNDVCEIIYKDKGSKFIGYAFRVMSLNEVEEKLDWVKKVHPSATHHCYAYRLRFDGEKYRANDDGEPNGTAGLPIYNQLLSAEVTYTLVVIVRYFGGTKLGVSGLIKAYKNSAEETLSNVKFKKLYKKQNFIIQFPYTSQSEAMRSLEKYNAELVSQTYMESCELEVKILKSNCAKFLKQMENFPSIMVKKIEKHNSHEI